jgi:hypothetical protein
MLIATTLHEQLKDVRRDLREIRGLLKPRNIPPRVINFYIGVILGAALGIIACVTLM